MSRQARFEEIEDDDDPPELELPDLESSSSALLSPNDLPQPSFGGMPKSADDSFKPQMVTQQDMEQFKRWSCIYPVYFDISRTLQEGRRVPLHMAVRNPLAKDLAEAAASMGIQSVLEPTKIHPKDWSNPGRIRYAFKNESGRKATKFNSKMELYAAVAQYLQSHPPTAEDSTKVQIPGYAVDKPHPPPAIPKGWKINEILPAYSAALTGGGISDNLMKDLMREEGVAPEPVAPKKKGKKKQ